MEEKRKSGFRQRSKSGVIEMNQALRSDDYVTFAVKAATALGLERPPKSVLRLFKVSGGAVIQNNDITICGVSCKWTLGNYLTLLKKSPGSVKVGVAYVTVDEISTSESEGHCSPGSSTKV